MITVTGLMKRYDAYTCIRYKDLIFEDGKSYVILGASGCGKSTYLNMLAGVISPTEGSITVDGTEVTKLDQRRKDALRVSSIGYIFQDFRLIEEMTVEDNIDILKLENVNTDKTDEVLEKLGILSKKKQKVDRLSGGEKQRVAITRALVKEPSIILADEPTGNLNYNIGRKVMEELIAAAKGKTLICVTHDDRLAELFDVVLDMNGIAEAEENA